MHLINMKTNNNRKFLIIAAMLLFCELSFSQTAVDFSTYQDGHYPNAFFSSGQYYLKDVNNKLNNFLGTWEYTNGNQKFQIVLTKTTMYHVLKPAAQMNFYQDGIDIQYKLYTNNQLTYTSPLNASAVFRTIDGLKLEGGMYDYGRLSKAVTLPGTNKQVSVANKPLFAHCTIKKILVNLSNNEPEKISFDLTTFKMDGYDTETYQGQPLFSIPNNIILVKVN